MHHQSQGGTTAAVPPTLSADGEAAAADLADRHGVGIGAVAALMSAVARGHGVQAQFNHPELGGMGQWSRGGMVMVGDIFNHGLKAKVAALCEDVAALLAGRDGAAAERSSLFVFTSDASHGHGWPAELGTPSSTGAQNDMRYAVFRQTRRLAIETGGKLTIYDTGDHRISGVGQQQDDIGMISLTSQHGAIRLDDLAVATKDSFASAPPHPATPTAAPVGAAEPSASAPSSRGYDEHDAIFAKIEGLALLHGKGILTDAEFAAKKAELLDRL